MARIEQEQVRAMLRLLHISDLHFGPLYVAMAGESLLRIAAELQPRVIVASGDFTQRAKPEQFAAAREFLNRLPPVPLVVVPGNHDVPLYRVGERLMSPYQHYCAHISPQLDQIARVGKAIIVALNSTAPHRAITNGRIRRWQLEFCEQAFADATDDAVRIVVAHHHFAPAPDYEGDTAMPKAKRALDAFTRMRVDLILGGHLHRAYVGNSLDVYPGVDREHGIIIAQCGTTTSRRGRGREREKNTFNFIEVDERTVGITHFMYFHEADGFAPISRHTFPRRGLQFLRSDSSAREATVPLADDPTS